MWGPSVNLKTGNLSAHSSATKGCNGEKLAKNLRGCARCILKVKREILSPKLVNDDTLKQKSKTVIQFKINFLQGFCD